ncbi:YecH family metal-binding protein [Vibrio vulnificus]|uniref:YecH family metal-binding protein n=1 Tax=Vibrio vulnificus TaxID=672 RepID=UPI00405A2648
MNDIHAHNLLHLLKEQLMDRAELLAHFGGETRFHTCKLQGLDLDSLLSFLLEREKISEQQGKFCVNLARICNH